MYVVSGLSRTATGPPEGGRAVYKAENRSRRSRARSGSSRTLAYYGHVKTTLVPGEGSLSTKVEFRSIPYREKSDMAQMAIGPCGLRAASNEVY